MTGVLHIVLARKPVEGTVAENCLRWGCGALWIDGTRVAINPVVDDPRLGGVGTWQSDTQGKKVYASGLTGERTGSSPLGRFPANLILGGEEVVKEFPVDTTKATGTKRIAAGGMNRKRSPSLNTGKITVDGYGGMNVEGRVNIGIRGHGDSGSASRFFFNFAEQESDE